MLKLERIGDEVYCDGAKLTIVTQSSKGEGKEQVNIEGLPGAGKRKWISLKKLMEGENILQDADLKPRATKGKDYELTEEEAQQVEEYQTIIDEYTDKIGEIVRAAQARYVKPVKHTKLKEMNEDELKAQIAYLQSILEAKTK